MSVSFDILPRPKAVLEANDLVTVKLRPDKNRTFDARQNNGLLESNMPGGTSLKAEQVLLLQGAVFGTSNAPCNISLKKDVIVTGDTDHAHIVCRHQINGLNHDLQLAKEKHAALQRQVEIEGRRMNKARTITHTPLNFNVGTSCSKNMAA